MRFSDGEMAWGSFNTSLRICKILRTYMVEIQQHPTQKPVALYKWLLTNYAKKGDRILDTHGGSMSSVIAALDMGFEIHCCELDPEYFEMAKKRIETHLLQGDLFKERPKINFNYPK